MKPILASNPYPDTNQSGKVAPRARMELLGTLTKWTMSLLVLITLGLGLTAQPTQANMCIPRWFEFDECDAANGEPASYCGASDAGSWIVGKIQYELDLIQKRMVDKFERMRELIPEDPKISQ